MTKQDTNFPVSELTERYGVGRSQLYTRINALKAQNPELAPFKFGVKSYVNQATLYYLDEMHRLITEEKYITEEAAAEVTAATPSLSEGGDRPIDSASIAAIKQTLQTEPLARYELLDRVVANGWQLPTVELAALLELDELGDEAFERYGYRFEISGDMWTVERR